MQSSGKESLVVRATACALAIGVNLLYLAVALLTPRDRTTPEESHPILIAITLQPRAVRGVERFRQLKRCIGAMPDMGDNVHWNLLPIFLTFHSTARLACADKFKLINDRLETCTATHHE